MIKGAPIKENKLNKENILSRITEYDILRAFWPSGRELKLNRAILSPFRNEDDASFIVGTKYGCITYRDLGDINYSGDIWKFVKQIGYYADFPSVLRAIDERFDLGLAGDGEVRTSPSPIITWEQPKVEVLKPPHFIVETRPFNKDELRYWGDYYQDVEDLKRENIYAVKSLYRNRRRLRTSPFLTFGYYYPDVDKWKIYRPHGKKGKECRLEERKWDGNLPFQYIEDLYNINQCEIAFVEKSKKDRMVLRKALGTRCICNVQAEDPACFNDEMLKYIDDNAEIKVAIGDNDKKGKEFSWWLTKKGYKHCNVPDAFLELGVSDFADMARHMGIESVTNHFKSKGYI